MSGKHLRSVAAAFALLGVAATSASAHPLEAASQSASPAAQIRPDDRAARVGPGQASPLTAAQPTTIVSDSEELDWTDVGLAAALGLVGAGAMFTVSRRRTAVTG